MGRDLAVISYDGSPEAAVSDPPLTSYAVDTRAAGRALAEMLIANIRGTAPEDLRRIVPARLIPRASDRLFTPVQDAPQENGPRDHHHDTCLRKNQREDRHDDDETDGARGP